MQSESHSNSAAASRSAAHPAHGAGSFQYLPALDGLRAVAVLAVMLYHANVPWVPGGFLGVEMFFVISGYLITSLLLHEWSAQGRIDLGAFWWRRARRLFPALALLLAGVVGFSLIFLPTEVASMRGDVWSTAGYVNNWYQIFSHKSYFESVGRPSLLRHMWSLAVEEQFYLLWPLVFMLALRRLPRAWILVGVILAALASAWWMAGLFQPDRDPSRVYYGTDTRAAGLLIGVALALVWRPGGGQLGAGAWLLDVVGLMAAGTVLGCFVLINEFQPFLYRGGFLLVSLLTAELLMVAAHPRAGLVPRLLSWGPLRWVGLRSYGIYLWHFPVFMLTRPQLDVPMDGPAWLAARFALTFWIAAASYRWLETPIRQGALERAWCAWQNSEGRLRQRHAWAWSLGGGSLASLLVLFSALLSVAKVPPPPDYLARGSASDLRDDPAAGSGVTSFALQALISAQAGAEERSVRPSAPFLEALSQEARRVSNEWAVAQAAAAASNAVIAKLAAESSTRATNVFPLLDGQGITAIGDSVMEGVAADLRRAFGMNSVIDADQGRLPWNTPAIVRHLHTSGRIHPVVILHIGNNGFFSPQVFDEIMAELREARRVVVVNVKAPRRWESINNAMLASAVRSYPNTVLVDWQRASGDQPQLFWKDGIHLRPAGARTYADLIVRAVQHN